MLIAVEHLAHSLNEGKDIIFPFHVQYVKGERLQVSHILWNSFL